MRKVLYMLVTGGILTCSSCDSPTEERADVVEQAEEVEDERIEGDVKDVAEERQELSEEMEEYNEAAADEVEDEVIR